MCVEEQIARPILVGDDQEIREIARANEISLEGIEIVDPQSDARTEGYIEVTPIESSRHMSQGNPYARAPTLLFESLYPQSALRSSFATLSRSA